MLHKYCSGANSINRFAKASVSLQARKQQKCMPINTFNPAVNVFNQNSFCKSSYGNRNIFSSFGTPKDIRQPSLSVKTQKSQNGVSDSEYDYDLFTIGAGSGGVRASRMCSQYGMKVAICEKPYSYVSSETEGGVGGTCVLRGCVPKKLMVFASHFSETFEDSLGFGWQLNGTPSHDWNVFMQAKRKELDRLNGIYKNILDKNDVELIQGKGVIIDKHTIEVEGKQYKARFILIASGGYSVTPPVPGVEHTITSDQILDIPYCPKKIAIVGAGYIAMEFASIFNSMGAETHLFFRSNEILKGFDAECRRFLTEQVAMKGIHLHPMTQPEKIEDQGNNMKKVYIKSTQDGKQFDMDFDTVLMATGRAPNTKNMGLQENGVQLNEKGFINVDEYSKTSVDNIYSIGDVTGRLPLTPVAIMEGIEFAKTVGLNKPSKPDYNNISSAVFTQPQLAAVGLTEEQATEKYGEVDVYCSSFRPMQNTLSGNPGKALMKLIVDPNSDVVLGAHMVGPEAAEIIQGIAVAVKVGLKKEQLDSVVGLHPTSAEEFVSMYQPTRQIRKSRQQQTAQ